MHEPCGAHHYSNIVLAEIYIHTVYQTNYHRSLWILKPTATEIAAVQLKMQQIDF